MYRVTKKAKDHYSKMGKASVAKRAEIREATKGDVIPLLPELRMRITVERFDCGEPTKHVFELKKGKRIDMYRVFVDGEKWKHCGLSAVLAGIRKATPRILSDISY